MFVTKSLHNAGACWRICLTASNCSERTLLSTGGRWRVRVPQAPASGKCLLYRTRPPSARANPVRSVSSKTVTSNNKRSTNTSIANIKRPRLPVSGFKNESNPAAREISHDLTTNAIRGSVQRPNPAIRALMVPNTSNNIKSIAAMRATRPSWRVSTVSERFETAVRLLMEVVASVTALVREVSSVPAEARAAEGSRSPVNRVASKDD